MQQFRKALYNNINYFDILGYFKLLRFLTGSFSDYAASSNREAYAKALINHCNDYMETLAVRYNFTPQRISEDYNINRISFDILDIIIDLLNNYELIDDISHAVNPDITLEDLKKFALDRKFLVKDFNSLELKYCIIQYGDDVILLNPLLKFYLMYLKTNKDKKALVQNFYILQDNFVSNSFKKYLENKLKVKIRFSDNCLGSQPGTAITITLTTLGNNPLNPVYILPLNGLSQCVPINLFNTSETLAGMNYLVKVFFGVNLDDSSPDKHLFFWGNRLNYYTVSNDIENIINRCIEEGFPRSKFQAEIPFKRGGELTGNFLFNHMLELVRNKFSYQNFRIQALELCNKNLLYYNAYLGIYMRVHLAIKDFLANYCIGQLTRLRLLAKEYLFKVYNIDALKILEEQSKSADISTIWNDNFYIVDINDLKGISLWIMSAYNSAISGSENFTINFLTQCMRIINLFTLNPLWYLNYIKPLLEIDEVLLESTSVDGFSRVKFIVQGAEFAEYEFRNLGMFLPLKSEGKLTLLRSVDNYKQEQLRSLLQFPLVTTLSDFDPKEESMLNVDDTCILINPDTLGCYFVDLVKLSIDERYLTTSESIEFSLEPDTEHVIVTTSSVYRFKPEDGVKVYLLEKINNDDQVLSNLGGYKTTLFQAIEGDI